MGKAKARNNKSNRTAVHTVHDDAPQDAAPVRKRIPVSARNQNQQLYIDAISTKALVFCTGEAGCGKSYIAAAKAAEALSAKEIERIIVTRPVLQAEEDLGFLPGTVAEKFAPYFRPIQDTLVEKLGASFFEYCLKPDVQKIEIAPMAYLRGRTFKNAFVILDEAQNVTPTQMKLFLTRIGENCIVVVNGDVSQCDLPKHLQSGLADALKRFRDTELVSVCAFDRGDCVRSDVCRITLEAYED